MSRLKKVLFLNSFDRCGTCRWLWLMQHKMPKTQRTEDKQVIRHVAPETAKESQQNMERKHVWGRKSLASWNILRCILKDFWRILIHLRHPANQCKLMHRISYYCVWCVAGYAPLSISSRNYLPHSVPVRGNLDSHYFGLHWLMMISDYNTKLITFITVLSLPSLQWLPSIS